MVADADLPEGTATQDDGADTTRELARARLGDVELLTERLVAAIFTDGLEWTDYSSVPREDLRSGCRKYLGRVLQILSGAVTGTEDDDVASDIGRRRAEQGVPLEVMLRTFRIGGRVVWESLLERAKAERVDPAVMLDVATSMWTVIDGLSSTLSVSYRNTEAEQRRRNDQRRHAMVEDLLAGRARDSGFARSTSKELDLPISSDYLVVVAEMRPDGSLALRGQRDALSSAGVRAVWQARADSLVGLIALERRCPQAILDALSPLARGRVGVSPPVSGLAEIGQAHQLALTALFTRPQDAVEVIPLTSYLPEAMLTSSPELARRLVDSELSDVLALPSKDRDMLLFTLKVWLEENCSTAGAAVRLHCHRNTVLNRLNRLETLIGRSLHGRNAYVALSLALTAHELAGG